MILDNKENYKTSDIEDVVSLDDTSMVSECDDKVVEITLGSKMLPRVEQPPTLVLKSIPYLTCLLMSRKNNYCKLSKITREQ